MHRDGCGGWGMGGGEPASGQAGEEGKVRGGAVGLFFFFGRWLKILE